MKNDILVPKVLPKDEVLRRVVQRYPALPRGAIEVLLHIKRVAAADHCVKQDALEAYGLSEGKFYVLAALFAEELLGHGAPSPSEIAERLGVTRATITGLLDGLERDGFLERCHDSHDRRSLTIVMTEKTRRFLDEYIPRSGVQLEAQMASLSETERQTLILLLSKIKVAP